MKKINMMEKHKCKNKLVHKEALQVGRPNKCP
jgi:hypothetical protein